MSKIRLGDSAVLKNMVVACGVELRKLDRRFGLSS